jgi:hypothetical protein
MELIKNYFKGWGAIRIFKIILAVVLGIGYYNYRETIYLFGAIILASQAVFNITCPGRSCETPIRKDDKAIIKTEKYEPNK